MIARQTAYLLLDVAGTPCALPHPAVAEVLPLPDLHAPPASGGWLAGFLDLGGVSVAVVDLASLLGLDGLGGRDGLYAHLVLLRDRPLAYRVDRVEDLLRVLPGDLRPVDGAGSLNGCVVAELVHAGRLVHVLEPDRLLSHQEGARLAALTRASADRLAALPLPASA